MFPDLFRIELQVVVAIQAPLVCLKPRPTALREETKVHSEALAAALAPVEVAAAMAAVVAVAAAAAAAAVAWWWPKQLKQVAEGQRNPNRRSSNSTVEPRSSRGRAAGRPRCSLREKFAAQNCVPSNGLVPECIVAVAGPKFGSVVEAGRQWVPVERRAPGWRAPVAGLQRRPSRLL